MNKRHYEHTLPNIRGSLSNTYIYKWNGLSVSRYRQQAGLVWYGYIYDGLNRTGALFNYFFIPKKKIL